MSQDVAIVDESVIARFAILKKSDRLAHAYMFIGPSGMGKVQTALSVAKLLNCEGMKNPFCDECLSCIKINSGNHPDVHIIETQDSETIKVEQVRSILEQVQFRPFIGQRKVFIIKNSECLTPEGANALLKTLEEPTATSLLILTTAVVEKNLDTIRSRCHAVVFLPTSKTALEEKLLEYYDDKKAVHFVSCFSDGSLGKAKYLYAQEFLKKKNVYVDQFIFSLDAESFIKKIIEDKADTRNFLDVLLSWVRDCFLIKSGVDDHRLVHLDRVNDLKKFARNLSYNDLKDLSGEIIKAYYLLAENLNIKLPLLIIKEKLWVK